MQAPTTKITFLGTGTSSGVPMIACNCPVCTSTDSHDKRLRSSILVETPTLTFTIDTTPDFRYQMLRTHTQQLDAILFTHPHKDHIGGLDDIRAYNYFLNKPMDVYANQLTVDALKREFYYIFSEQHIDGLPKINLTIIDTTPFHLGGLDIIPIPVWHDRMTVYGYRMGDVTYITDANRIDPEQKEKIKGSSILIINALRKEKHKSHFTLSEALALAEELAIPQVYLTHISHQLGKHADISKELPVHVQLAYDGLILNI